MSFTLRSMLFIGALSLILATWAVAFAEIIPSSTLNNGCKRHERNHSGKGKKCKKTVVTATFPTWNNVTVTGTGDIFQQVANITQGTKIALPSINFNSSTTAIVFPTPTITLAACEGDTIFFSAVVSLDPGSSIISTQPLTVQSSDSKNIITPGNSVLIDPNMLESNPTNMEINYNNNTFRTIFPGLPF